MVVKKDVTRKIQLVMGVLFVLISVVGLVFTLKFLINDLVPTKSELSNWTEEKMGVTDTTNIKEIVQAKADIALIWDNYWIVLFLNAILIVLEVILSFLSLSFIFKALK